MFTLGLPAGGGLRLPREEKCGLTGNAATASGPARNRASVCRSMLPPTTASEDNCRVRSLTLYSASRFSVVAGLAELLEKLI